MSEHVIALDPGQRTGWASARMDVDRFELIASGVKAQREMALWLAEQQGVAFMNNPGRWEYVGREYDVLVWESWRPFLKNGSMDWIKGDRLLPAQHVGQIRLIAWLSGARGVEQEPSQKKPYLASLPPALRALDAESSEQHDQDARRHLWGYFFENWFTGQVPPADCVQLPG